MKYLLLLVVFVSINAFSDRQKNKKTYSLTDIQVLQKSGNWRELLEHIEYVSPSSRDKDWEAMLKMSLEKGFEDFSKESGPYYLTYFAEKFMDRYPLAQKNPELSFKLAKAIRKRVSNVMAIKYFEWGLVNNYSAKNCEDDDLQELRKRNCIIFN